MSKALIFGVVMSCRTCNSTLQLLILIAIQSEIKPLFGWRYRRIPYSLKFGHLFRLAFVLITGTTQYLVPLLHD